MPERDGDAVRAIGHGRSGTPVPPERGIAVLLIFVLIAGVMTLLVGTKRKGDSAVTTAPELLLGTLPSSTTMLDRTPVVTATMPSTAVVRSLSATTISDEAGLAEFVPGWPGRLHMTVDRLEGGWRIVEWSADGGEPRRLTLTDQLQDVRFDAGAWIASVNDASLPVGPEPDPNKILQGVIGYAWHQTDPGRIAWLSGDADGPVTLHQGTAMEDGVDFHQVGDLAWLAVPDDGALNLAAFGDWGFLVERWTVYDDVIGVEVFTLDPDGLVLQEGGCRLRDRLATCSGFWPAG